MGSSTRKILRAPAERAALTAARDSTLVTEEGTQMATLGLTT